MMLLPERIFPDVYEPPPRENLSTTNDYRAITSSVRDAQLRVYIPECLAQPPALDMLIDKARLMGALSVLTNRTSNHGIRYQARR